MSLQFFLMRDGILRQDMELLAMEAPKITMDSEREVKLTLQGRFLPLESANLLTDHIVSMLDGQTIGEFVVTSCKTIYEGDCKLWQLEAGDQTVIVARHRQKKSRFFRKGSDYMVILQQLLGECGIFRLLADSCDDVLQCDRQWELGAKTLDILNELLQEIGFEELWFDSDGYARLQRYCPPVVENVAYFYGQKEREIEPQLSGEWDVFSAKNVFVAVADSPEYQQSWMATASNDDPASPVSTVNLGRVMAPVLVVDNVASQGALQAFVERVRDENMLSAQTVAFSTKPEIHQIRELFWLEHPELDGIYREVAWTMDFDSWTMSHEGRRVYFL